MSPFSALGQGSWLQQGSKREVEASAGISELQARAALFGVAFLGLAHSRCSVVVA